MKKRCIRCTLKTNRFQKRYVTHHLYTTRRVYISICRILYKERTVRLPRTKDEMYRLCREGHRDYMKVMDEKEIIAMVHELLHYQWSIRQQSQKTSSYFTCTITNQDLVWRSVSLKTMLSKECCARISQDDFLYACLLEKHHQLHLRIYMKIRTKS